MPFQHAINALEEESNLYLRTHTPLGEVPSAERQEVLRAYGSAITYLKVANLGGLSSLVSLVRQWGSDRNIIGPDAKATVESQFAKLLEEVDEIREGIEKKDQHETIDGIGDTTVVLILLSELVGVRFETCLTAAYEEIRERKGSMIDGTYVKESK